VPVSFKLSFGTVKKETASRGQKMPDAVRLYEVRTDAPHASNCCVVEAKEYRARDEQ
tara:strand:+ start:1162 stop:1332 length:171 start_codon:yes stop_codon:yes gene_type:complete